MTNPGSPLFTTKLRNHTRLITALTTFFLLTFLLGATAFMQARRNPVKAHAGQDSPLVGPVTVTATAGTTGPTDYATLKLAFDAINAGTHQGAITIDIVSSTTEGTTPATLNSSGAGSAVYTSVLIRPANDGVSISGNPVTGFGVIQLNGADNVTIDGDNPNTGGINRNLTVANTATNTVIANSAVRIATSAAVTSADNNTIKNCILNGNVTSGNASAITSTSSSSNSSFGIYAGGNGGATATGAPTAITSVTANTAPSGTTINGLTIDNNSVNQCARAIVFNGAATSVSNGVAVTNNVIGDQGTPTPATPPYASPVTTVYTKGVWVAGTNSVTVTGNTLKNIMSYVATTITTIELVSPIGTTATISNNTSTNTANNGTSSIVKALLVSSAGGPYTISGNTITNVQALAASSGTDAIEVTGAATGGVIERNKVTTVYNRSASTFGAYGINLTAGTGINIRNNFVSDINMDMTGGFAFSTQFSVHGIRIAGGTGHKIYHNSVNLFGSLLGTPTSSILTSAFTPTVSTITGLDVRNNIFSNTMTGGTTSVAHVSIFLPSSATSAMNLTINNNDYFSGTTAGQSGIAHVGTTYTSPPAGPPTYAGLYTAANFNPADTTATTNLRTYTNTLSAAGTNDSASKVVDPQFVSNTDLHIAVASPMVDMGANVGVNNDIDGQLRVPPPDIGADEPSGTTPPANDIAATAFVNPTSGGTKGSGVPFAPQASFTNNGTSAQINVPVRYRILDASPMEVYNQTAMIPSINSGQTVTVTFPNATLAVGTYTIIASAELAGDQNTANDTIMGTLNVVQSFNGTYTVGTGGNFTSLTNSGGIFEALNAAQASGNVTINITSNLTTETGTVALNELPAGIMVTIKPSGAARTISGASPVNLGLIRLNGADNVTIDGSTSGGTDRSLTITNTSTGASAVIQLASLGAGAGCTNDTVKNTILSTAVDYTTATTFTAGISNGGATTGNVGADNDNDSFINNQITRVSFGIYSVGESAANLNQNTVITDNLIGPAAFGADQIGRVGICFAQSNMGNISRNEVRFVGVLDAQTSSGGAVDKMGIAFAADGWSSTQTGGLAVSNTVVSRNLIHDIVEENTFSAVGIGDFSGNGAAVTANTIVNNIIYNVRADGTAGDNSVGIGIPSGNGDVVAFNSIFTAGDLDPGVVTTASTSSFGIQISSTSATNLTLKDNISFVNLTSNTATLKHGALSIPAAFAWGTGGSDYNDLFFPAANTQDIIARVGVTDYTTIGAYQAAVAPQDANSKSVDPMFVSATDLHLQASSTLIGMGTPITGVTTDFDNETRDAAPDIGADEFLPNITIADQSSVEGDSPSPPHNVNVTITLSAPVNQQVTVHWATAPGTATPNVDYTTSSGDAIFGPNQTMQTIMVPIISDIIDEGNETFFINLTMPANASIADSQSAVTIIDDDLNTSNFDIDGKDDFAVFRPSAFRPGDSPDGGTNAVWYILNSNDGSVTQQQFGASTDIPVAGDYDGDGRKEIAVWRPSEGAWYVSHGSAQNFARTEWGLSTDIPVPGDYDGDTKTDIAVFRPSNGNWYILRSSDGGLQTGTWGNYATDNLVPSDYDGDGKTDLAVFRTTDNTWYIKRSSDGSLMTQQWGLSDDKVVPADYDRDGKTDIAVWRPSNGTFYVLRSSDGALQVQEWGLMGDIPVVADYDNDGKADFAVWRPSVGTYFIIRSSDGGFTKPQYGPVRGIDGVQWGQAGDKPVRYVPEQHL